MQLKGGSLDPLVVVHYHLDRVVVLHYCILGRELAMVEADHHQADLQPDMVVAHHRVVLVDLGITNKT